MVFTAWIIFGLALITIGGTGLFYFAAVQDDTLQQANETCTIDFVNATVSNQCRALNHIAIISITINILIMLIGALAILRDIF